MTNDDIRSEEIDWLEENAAEQDEGIHTAGWDFWLDQRDECEARELRRGAQLCREMIARFVEHQGFALIAASIRANWDPAWGPDPGPPKAAAAESSAVATADGSQGV